jgi:Holliday junction resolvasome RuvABC endonuclease subunit
VRTVLGIDGGLAHLGWAVVKTHEPGTWRPMVVDGGCIETWKREGIVSESHTTRALEVHKQLVDIVEKHQPDEICAEAFSPPRDSRNACMLAWSWGILCAVAGAYGLPIRAKVPMSLKGALTGNRTAKKPEMILAARAQYPESVPLFSAQREDLQEHFADAIAAIHFFHGPAPKGLV